MVDNEVRSYRQLLDELARHCKERSSGTIFFNLVTGQSARLVLNKGVICWIAYEELRGEEAIEAITAIYEARFSFNPLLKLAIGQQQLPSTSRLLKRLYKDGDAASTNEQKDVPVVTEMVSPASSLNDVYEKSEERPYSLEHVRMALENEAMEFLGPMAKILCADYLKAMPNYLSHSEVREVIGSLVQDINDDTKRQRFMGRVKKALSIT
jgi:hypothetical protein